MKSITFYLDFISPYAYLAFEQLPKALEGISYSVRYQPVLFAAMLKHHDQHGPAEIAPKREWTYRQVLWLAHTLGIDLAMPASHPFNPLVLLRLAIARSAETAPGEPNRYVCETLFRHVWCGGGDAVDAQRLASLQQGLFSAESADAVQALLGSEPVKTQLKKNTDAAIATGVFGVPTFAVDDKVFWGLDSLPMLRAYLLEDSWFQGPDWAAGAAVGAGVQRR
ncbi:MAG: 2-hydroxychromene-2-carboxylate isomerase [Polaromonas sp.]|nr:2-hydroxychromene-2-carboxylate isomerase [Polaromonas sp.]